MIFIDFLYNSERLFSSEGIPPDEVNQNIGR